MQWRKPHPWDGNYAIPDYIMDEPARFGTHTTTQRRRRSYGPLGVRPPGWSPHLALPDYIKKEQVGQGALRTKYRPRRSVSTLIPQYLGNYESELGDVASRNLLGSSRDPFKQYGERISEYVMGTIGEVDPEWRKLALTSVLSALDPGLPARVNARANRYKSKRGWDSKTALQAAIATSVSDGLSKEIVKIGKGRMPAVKSLAGLGTYDGALEGAYSDLAMSLGGYEALGWGLSSVTSAVSSVGSAIKSGAKTVASAGYKVVRAPDRAVTYAAKKAYSGVKTAVTWTGSKIKAGAQTAYSWGKTAVKKIYDLTCKVMKSPVSDVAAGAVAAYYGVPPKVGVAGHKAVTGVMCGKDGKPLPPDALTQPGGLLPQKKFPTLLVVGGGAAALGILYLATRKG